MWCHLSNLMIWLPLFPLFPFFLLLAQIVWRSNRSRHPFIDESGREGINFTSSIILYIFIVFAISLTICGLGAASASFIVGGTVILLLIIAHLCGILFGSINAYAGIVYKYPLTIAFLRSNYKR
jgi:uncharacterized protein